MVIFCLLQDWVPFESCCLWGMSWPWGAARWMLDQVSAVRASACVFQAKLSTRSALCCPFSPPSSASFLLCFAFHLLECVYWFSVMQTATKQDLSKDLQPAMEYIPNNLNTNQPPVAIQGACHWSAFEALLHCACPCVLRAGWKAEIQPGTLTI